MKKTLSLILAVMMLLGCMSVTAFATTDNSTDINLTVAKALTYDMVIPEDVTNLSYFGIYSVGLAKVQNVKNATDKTVISYTAETADFKSEGKTDIPASYYTDLQGTNTFPTTAVEVYKNNADVESIPTMYVGISENAWNAAENGTYKATVTFNFDDKEVPASATIPEGGSYKLSTGETLSAGAAFPAAPTTGDKYTFGDYVYTYGVNDDSQSINGWSVKVIEKGKTEYGALLENILGKPITDMMSTFDSCENMTTAPAIPAGVTNMGSCFRKCYALVNAPAIPAGVTNMWRCFYDCTSLKNAPVIPAGVTNMSSCFSGCSDLTTAPAIPAGVTDMSSCFCDCTSLKNAPTIPASVTDMSNCFSACSKLEGTIEINATNLDEYGDCFAGAGTNGTGITLTGSCPDLAGIAATNTDGKVTVLNKTVIPVGGKYQISGGDLIEGNGTAAFPAAPTTGDVYTFGDYTYTYTYEGQWNAKVISNSKSSYGELCESILGKPISLDHTFDTCTQMTTAPTIPAGVTDMTSCFAGCSNLTTAPSIPASVTNMSSCFDNCQYLTAAPVLPDGVKNLSSCFSTCKRMTTAPTIPAGVTNLSSCFMRCEKLAGTIEINAENLSSYMNCFFLAGGKGSGIILTGSCPDLADIAADADSENVTVGSN